MKRFRRVLVLLLMIVVVAFGALTWLASSRLICPRRQVIQDYHREILDKPTDHGMKIQPFTVGVVPCLMCEPVAQPGAAIKGNKLRVQLQAGGVNLAPWGVIKGTLVLLHGHNGCKEDHLPVAERFCAAGFRCLLVDLPGHGQHPEPFACFGVHESALPREVLHAAARQFRFTPGPVGLFGVSQGGAIVLQAAARGDESWFAVAELSSFASLDRVIGHQAREYFGFLAPVAKGVVTGLVHHRAGYVPAQVRPVDAASRLSIPVLIGHGDADAFVTPEQARELFQAVPSTRKQFLNIPGAGHGNVLVTEAPVYSTVSRFFLDALPPGQNKAL